MFCRFWVWGRDSGDVKARLRMPGQGQARGRVDKNNLWRLSPRRRRMARARVARDYDVLLPIIRAGTGQETLER
jgi:hypothetical protein